jgi:hypothetical protein
MIVFMMYMRKVLTVVVFVWICALVSQAQTNKAQIKPKSKPTPATMTEPKKSVEPTLQETLAWLREKLPVNGTFSPEPMSPSDSQLQITFEQTQFDSCNVSWVSNTGIEGASNVGTIYVKISMSLGDLDASSLVVKPIPLGKDAVAIEFKTTDEKKSIKQEWGRKLGGKIEDSSGYFIILKDAEIATRIVNGLKHAIPLCRKEKEKEPF